MALQFVIGLDTISSYKRLSYTAWHALAEFVDNSTQAYFNNKEILDIEYAKAEEKLDVSIVYERDNDIIRIVDNSIGMNLEELETAVHVSKPPTYTGGRSKFGMGMKTAACWFGDVWTVRTKKLGEAEEHFTEVDVNRIASGDGTLPTRSTSGKTPSDHYTIIEIKQLHRKLAPKTRKKIRDFLSSMYRQDFRKGLLELRWMDDALIWDEIDSNLLKAEDGSVYKKDFKFEVAGKKVYGWVGLLDAGGRSKAGFSKFVANRVIQGHPDAWRPEAIFGQLQGSNDLINQRVVGEIHLDDFLVSHTKDDIDWSGDEEEEVEKKLRAEASEYLQVARTRRKRDGGSGPTEVEVKAAVDQFVGELTSEEMIDALDVNIVPPPAVVDQAFENVIETESLKEPTFKVKLNDLIVKVFLSTDLSANDPYYAYESTKSSEVIVVINMQHPHVNELKGSEGVLNYLRHCVYDGLAEHKAAQKTAPIHVQTIKMFKDRFLRLPLDMERIEPVSENEVDN